MTTADQNLAYEKNRGGVTLRRVPGVSDPTVTRFVARKYYFDTKYFSFQITFDQLLGEMMAADDIYQQQTETITAYHPSGEILGTIKKILPSQDRPLPVERVFQVDLARLIRAHQPVSSAYELSRFATSGRDRRISKYLIEEIIVTSAPDDLVVAGLDVRVLAALRRNGLPWQAIGAPQDYLGSVTLPAALSIRDIDGRFSYRRLSAGRELSPGDV